MPHLGPRGALLSAFPFFNIDYMNSRPLGHFKPRVPPGYQMPLALEKVASTDSGVSN
jgi:hypothetical protein